MLRGIHFDCLVVQADLGKSDCLSRCIHLDCFVVLLDLGMVTSSRKRMLVTSGTCLDCHLAISVLGVFFMRFH